MNVTHSVFWCHCNSTACVTHGRHATTELGSLVVAMPRLVWGWASYARYRPPVSPIRCISTGRPYCKGRRLIAEMHLFVHFSHHFRERSAVQLLAPYAHVSTGERIAGHGDWRSITCHASTGVHARKYASTTVLERLQRYARYDDTRRWVKLTWAFANRRTATFTRSFSSAVRYLAARHAGSAPGVTQHAYRKQMPQADSVRR
eukprot:3347177-Rhodomonas_salina.1